MRRTVQAKRGRRTRRGRRTKHDNRNKRVKRTKHDNRTKRVKRTKRIKYSKRYLTKKNLYRSRRKNVKKNVKRKNIYHGGLEPLTTAGIATAGTIGAAALGAGAVWAKEARRRRINKRADEEHETRLEQDRTMYNESLIPRNADLTVWVTLRSLERFKQHYINSSYHSFSLRDVFKSVTYAAVLKRQHIAMMMGETETVTPIDYLQLANEISSQCVFYYGNVLLSYLRFGLDYRSWVVNYRPSGSLNYGQLIRMNMFIPGYITMHDLGMNEGQRLLAEIEHNVIRSESLDTGSILKKGGRLYESKGTGLYFSNNFWRRSCGLEIEDIRNMTGQIKREILVPSNHKHLDRRHYKWLYCPNTRPRKWNILNTYDGTNPSRGMLRVYAEMDNIIRILYENESGFYVCLFILKAIEVANASSYNNILGILRTIIVTCHGLHYPNQPSPPVTPVQQAADEAQPSSLILGNARVGGGPRHEGLGTLRRSTSISTPLIPAANTGTTFSIDINEYSSIDKHIFESILPQEINRYEVNGPKLIVQCLGIIDSLIVSG